MTGQENVWLKVVAYRQNTSCSMQNDEAPNIFISGQPNLVNKYFMELDFLEKL